MSLSTSKVELARKILSTNDKELINYLNAVFSSQPKDWWAELPDDVKVSVNRGLIQAQKRQTIPHSHVMKKYKKWLKK
jgi:hypothetical protein